MLGNVLDMKSVLQDIEGRKSVTMVRNWSLHLGLITTPPGTLIHDMKNLAGTSLLHFYRSSLQKIYWEMYHIQRNQITSTTLRMVLDLAVNSGLGLLFFDPSPSVHKLL